MMRIRHVATAAAITLSLASCQRTYSDYNSTPSYSPPPPLQGQPVAPVQSSQLPDPTQNGSQFPAAPQAAPNMAGQQNTALASSGQPVTKESMVGSWKVSNGGTTCDMFLTLTNLGSGSRGGTRGCVGELTTMGSWEVVGNQVSLKDRNGNQIGSVFKVADSKLNGTTASGQPITLSR